MDLNLENKIVVITGATGEIGTAICKAFLNEKAIVIPLYRDLDKLNKLKEQLKVDTRNKFFCPFEAKENNEEELIGIFREIYKKNKRIDVLVNGIGAVIELPFMLLDEENWEEQLDINLNTTARIIRIAAKYMYKSKSGSIINISSIMSSRFGSGVSAYSVAKAGLDRLTEVLARELGHKNIRVNSVCPGLISSGMSEAVSERESDFIKEYTALNRNGTPDDVAKAVLFLSSESCSSFITGHKLIVDGGLSL